MKVHEIREMKDDELKKAIEEEEKNLVDLKFSHQLAQLTNTGKLKIVKKDLARLKTVLGERQRAEKTSAKDNKQGVNA
jgi:large subunit ribosomal protein L29